MTDRPATLKSELQEWSHFIQSQSHILRERPALLFQQAANQPDSSTPALKAMLRYETGLVKQPWLRLINKLHKGDGCLITLKGPSRFMATCAFSPDGYRIIAGWDGGVNIWNAVSGEIIHTIETRTSLETCAVSPDGSRAACTHYQTSKVLVCDLENARIAGIFSDHSEWAKCCAYSPDGGTLLTGSIDNNLRLWDATTFENLRTLTGHNKPVQACAYSPDGTRIISASSDDTVRIWDVRLCELLLTLQHSESVYVCVFSLDGNQIATATLDNRIRIWDANTGLLQLTLIGHDDWVEACSFSPDGMRLVSASRDRTVRIWDLKTGALRSTLIGHGDVVVDVAFSPDGSLIASASQDETVKVWDAEFIGETRQPVEHSDSAIACAFSGDNKRIVTGSWDSKVKVWDAGTGANLDTLDEHTDRITVVDYSPDERQIVSAAGEQILLWDSTARKTRALPSAHLRVGYSERDEVYDLDYSPDGERLVSAHQQHGICIWNPRSGNREITVEGQLILKSASDLEPDEVRSLAASGKHWSAVCQCIFSPDGRRIVSASEDRTLAIWDAQDGERLLTLIGHTDAVSSCMWSPDSDRILSGSRDGTLRLWDSTTGECLAIVPAHYRGISDCRYSPDGGSIVSASDDATIKVWDAVSDLRLLLELRGHSGRVSKCKYSHDGKRLISISDDCTLHVWDANDGEDLIMYRGPAPFEDMSVAPHGLISAVDRSGRLFILEIENLALNTPRVTAAYIYRFSKRRFDRSPSVLCSWCGQRFCLNTESRRLRSNLMSRLFRRSEKLNEAQTSSEDGRRTHCPDCHKALMLNTFVVDNRKMS